MNATTTVLQTDSLLFRPTLPDDLERICTIIRQAQAQMRLRGSRQWQNGYPAAAHITDDIDRGYGHVLCTHTGLVVAYGAVVFDGEPAYAEIDGVGHLPCVEKPKDYAAMLIHFLKEVGHV